ncbi:MAG: FHA domain-containing protein [Deltaproteobacteria bacterium]|nr:FHA domain-containing protein [Deltaproteobacteria bacterium]
MSMIEHEPPLSEYINAAEQLNRATFCERFDAPVLISTAADLSELGEAFQTAKTNSLVTIDPAELDVPRPADLAPVITLKPSFPDKDEVLIGRKEENDLVLNHESVSGFHASVHHVAGNRYALQDRGSTNGTRLNGTSIEPERKVGLREGDVLTLGSCSFLFYTPGGLYDMLKEGP